MSQQFIDITYLNIGVIPYSSYMNFSPYWGNFHNGLPGKGSLDRCMATLSPEDQRKARRKFRKLLRKAAKCLRVSDERVAKMGFCSKQSMVYSYVWRVLVKRDFGNVSDNIWD